LEIFTRVIAYLTTLTLIVLIITTWPAAKLIPMLYFASKAFGGAIIESAEKFDHEAQPWVKATMILPDNRGTLDLIRRHSHPMLAEFDMRLSYPYPLGTNTTVDLPANTGGQTKTNVFWYPKCSDGGPFIRLVDRNFECVVSLQDGTTYRLHHYKGKVYIAPLSNSGSYSISEADGEEPVVSLGDKPAHVTSLIFSKDPGTYLGRFDGNRSSYGFVSEVEQEKELIDPK